MILNWCNMHRSDEDFSESYLSTSIIYQHMNRLNKKTKKQPSKKEGFVGLKEIQRWPSTEKTLLIWLVYMKKPVKWCGCTSPDWFGASHQKQSLLEWKRTKKGEQVCQRAKHFILKTKKPCKITSWQAKGDYRPGQTLTFLNEMAKNHSNLISGQVPRQGRNR